MLYSTGLDVKSLTVIILVLGWFLWLGLNKKGCIETNLLLVCCKTSYILIIPNTVEYALQLATNGTAMDGLRIFVI